MHLLFSQQVIILSFFSCRKKNWACHHLIFPPPLIFRDITELNWIFLNSRVKNESNHPPSKTTKNYFATAGPRFLNAFQSKATNACMRSEAVGCWLRAMWRTSSPSGHSPVQLSGLPTWSPQVPEMIRAVQMSQGSCKPWAWLRPLSAPLFSCHSWLGHWPDHGLRWDFPRQDPLSPAVKLLICQQ